MRRAPRRASTPPCPPEGASDPKGRKVAAAALGLLLLGGCGLAAGGLGSGLAGSGLAGSGLAGGDDVEQAGPREGLAQKAVLAAMNQAAVTRSPVDQGPVDQAPVNQAPGPSGSGGKSAATVESAPGRPDAAAVSAGDDLAVVKDPLADEGGGPRYADLAKVAFTDSDEGLGVSVTFGALVPGRLARGEIENVGVDLYRPSKLDELLGRARSDYQVRLAGGAYGWRAFFRTRSGYVAFPGSFTVSGRTLRVLLPWDAVGGRRQAEVEAFVDWSSGVGRLCTDGSTRVSLAPG